CSSDLYARNSPYFRRAADGQPLRRGGAGLAARWLAGGAGRSGVAGGENRPRAGQRRPPADDARGIPPTGARRRRVRRGLGRRACRIRPLCLGGRALCLVDAGGDADRLFGGADVGRADAGGDYGFAAVTAAFVAVAVSGTIESGRINLSARIAEAGAAEKDEVVSLLLREFEENEADWLWQIDTSRRVRSANPRFAYA